MRTFNYKKLKNEKWDSEIISYIANLIAGERGYIIVDGGSNGRKPFKVSCNDEENKYDIENDHSWFYNELNDFYSIISNRNMEEANSLLNNTISVMNIIDKAKASADIVFEDEKV